MTGISGIELRESWGGDTLQHFLGEYPKQLPADVQRLEYRAVLVVALWDKVLLELW